MATDTNQTMLESIGDPVLVNAIYTAVQDSMAMCDVKFRCVAMSTIPSRDPGKITGLIGVHGDVTGYVTVNIPEAAALELVGSLLMETFEKVDHQVIDGVGELTNMIAGGIKKSLFGTQWGFSDVTVPSIIVGQKYDIAFSQGFRFLSLTFEHVDCESLLVSDRLLRVAVSLFRK